MSVLYRRYLCTVHTVETVCLYCTDCVVFMTTVQTMQTIRLYSTDYTSVQYILYVGTVRLYSMYCADVQSVLYIICRLYVCTVQTTGQLSPTLEYNLCTDCTSNVELG